MRLSQKIIQEHIKKYGSIMTSDLVGLGFSMKQSNQQLNRMYLQGKLNRSASDGRRFEYFSVLSRKTENQLVLTFQDEEDLFNQIITWVQNANHPSLNSLPSSHGGKQTKGSGHLSAWKSLIRILVQISNE